MKVPTELAAYHKLKVSGIVKSTAISARDKRLRVWNYIIQAETAHGTQFIVTKPDGLLFIVPGSINEIIRIPRAGKGGDKLFSYLHTMYGLTEREETTKVVHDVMRSFAVEEGVSAELRRFSAYNAITKTAYLSAYDGFMYKIDGGNDIPRVPSGEDEVFFINDDGGLPIKADIAPHGLLIDTLTSGNFMTGLGGIEAKYQRMALIVWLFALAFPDTMPTKPLLMIEGAPGSGKTSFIEMIQLALLGKSKAMSISKSQEADFGVLLLRSPIALIDNLDSYIEWVADKVCSYATGGEFPKRKLFTDDEEVIIRPHAFITVASKNPASFRREDTADRCIVIRFDRRSAFTRLKKLKEQIEVLRPKLFGEYLYYVNRIVKEIRDGAFDEETVETYRMADFAALARVVGRVFDWSAEDIHNLMEGLASERDAFIAEEDPIVELLHAWIAYAPSIGPRNIGREVTVHQLFSDLDTMAKQLGIQFYKHPRILAQKIRGSHVLRDFNVQMDANSGQKTYRIWRHTDAKLDLVPDEHLEEEIS